MENFIKSLIVFLGSIIKFSMGTFTAMEAELGLGGSLANIMGGIVGIVLFTYLGSFIQDYMVRKYPSMFARKFTKSNRMLIKVKQRFGLGGIAALTPILLSIPVGVFFALTLTHDKKKILVSMIMSMLFWATVICLPYYLFDFSILGWITSVFER